MGLQTAQVRLVNAAPGTAGLVFLAGERRLSPPLGYGEASFVNTVSAGLTELTARADADAGERAALSVALQPDSLRTVVALVGHDGLLHLLSVNHAFAPPRAGSIRVRVVHAAPQVFAVNVDVGDDGTVEAVSLPGESASAVDGFELAADTRCPLALIEATTGNRIARFWVPALPAQSEVLLVLTGVGARPSGMPEGLSMLGVARSAVLGFLRPAD